MLISILLAVVALAYIALGIVWAVFVRKLSKTRIRFFGIVASLLLAIAGTAIVRATVFTAGNLPWIGAKLSPQLMLLLEQSPTLCDVALGCVSALAAPLLFLAFFLVFSFLTWIIGLLMSLIFGAKFKEHDQNAPYARVRTLVLSIVSVLIVVVVWMVPISTYAHIAPIVTDAIAETQMLNAKDQQTLNTVANDYIAPLNDNILLNTFRVMGVSGISDSMTRFNVKGTSVQLTDELHSVAKLACNVVSLTQKDIASYDEKEVQAILSIPGSFKESEMLPVVAGDLLYNATDAWKNDQAFVDIRKDVLYIGPDGMFKGFADELIDILHTDAKNPEVLCADLSTFADVFAIIIRGEVLSNIKDPQQLVATLSKEGLVNSLITELGENDSMKPLITEVTNIGVRAIATSLGIKEDAETAYNEMLDTIAGELNSIKDLDSAEQVAVLTETLNGAFEDAGMVVDKQVLDYYSGSMIDSLLEASNGEDIDADDIKAFFAVYAWSSAEYSEIIEGNTSSKDSTHALAGETPADAALKALLVGTVFEGKSLDALRSSGPAVLARVTVKLSKIDVNASTTVAEQAKLIVAEEYSAMGNEALKSIIMDVTVTKPVAAKTVTVTASMKAPETMKNSTVLVTMDMLLADSKQAATNITNENLANEAKAIESIFATASSLIEKSSSSKLELSEVAADVGSILDSLSSTSAFGQKDDNGKDKAAYIFTAVLQSKEVRNAAGVDMDTATQLGDKGSSGDNVNYEQTFQNVSDTITIMSNADKGELTEEEIERMIRNINPQSAGMIEVYVTEDRLVEQYNVPEEFAVTAAPLVSNIFGYMANELLNDQQYANEAKAINNILTLTMAARDNINDKDHRKHLFKNGEDDTTSVLSTDAYGAVSALMASNAVADSLRKTEFEADPFELGDMLHKNEDTDEAQDIKDAISDYYANNRTDYNKVTLTLIGMLFGFTADEIAEILAD